jgi:hypothetical protein
VKLPMRVALAFSCAAIVSTCVTVQGALAGSPKIGKKVAATVKKSLFVSGDKEAIRRVKFTHYWCRWNDGQVEVHVVVKNPLAAHITIHIQPNYRLKDAGLHGDGSGSVQDIGVNAHATRYWSKRIGSAEGVDGTPKITVCGPEINGIDLG